jgi:membrane-bound serine protease (ClpP class)
VLKSKLIQLFGWRIVLKYHLINRRRDFRKARILAFVCLWLAGLFFPVVGPVLAQTESGGIHFMEIEGVINPVTANYLERVLDEATAQDARLIILTIDTPGGLDTSMRTMTRAMLNSPVPVAVYVAPSGARAASAGLFILVASHVAAMAPGTNTGAAHPVAMGGDIDEVQESKAVNDAAATIRALAIERGRNADWAEQAVRESVSATEREAQELQIIEVIARDTEELIEQIDGLSVETIAGPVTLDLSGAPHIDASMNFAEQFLHVISDPNIAFILLSVGSIGIIAELYNPGALFPGITGAIALILAFFSLGNLPTNWAGVALVGLGIALFIAELSAEGTGILGIGAVVSILLGGIILFRPFRPASPALPDMSVNPFVLGGATGLIAVFLLLVVTQVMRSRKAPISTGFEHFIGQSVRVYRDLNPRGRVWFEGQPWNAELPEGQVAQEGSHVRIVAVDGLTLKVELIEAARPPEIEMQR